MALGSQIVDFIGLDFFQDAIQVTAVREVPVMQDHLQIFFMWILIQVVNPAGVKTAGPPDNAVHLVTFPDEQLSKVGPILSCDAGYKCDFIVFGHLYK